MLRSKPIRSKREELDGVRMSVMSRHTLNDGQTPDETITPDMYDMWWPHLAAPAQLLGDYYKRDLSWDEFEVRYNEHLDIPQVHELTARLAHLALEQNVTVLCTEDTPEQCHRRLLVERCKLIIPKLIIDIH